jgi:hypothetical protein
MMEAGQKQEAYLKAQMITKRLQPAFSKLKGANQKRLTPFHY